MTSDLDLLRRFARDNSQDAFAEIVRRHVNLVYSAALRQVRSPQLAEDIAQSVFADLARVAATPSSPLRASDASSPATLTPWLYAVTRRTAVDVIRKESRRQLREQIAVEMNNMNAIADDWTQIAPLLDDAMAALDETDRSVVLLRYFENKSLREVGEALGASEDAAQKRVSRAVEKLREFFSKEKVTVGASGLAVLISTNAVQSAPVGLAAAISAASVFAGTTVSTSTAIAATKAIAMTTLQKTIIGAALTATVGAGVFEAHQASQLRDQVQTLQQQQASLAEEIQQLQRERDNATNQVTGLLMENARLNSNPDRAELLRLRGEVGVLRRQLESAKTREVEQSKFSKEPGKSGHQPGSFISKSQLANAGYATAEAATETYFHAMWSGDFRQLTNAMSAKMLTGLEALNDPVGREKFQTEFSKPDLSSGIQGIQLLAKKVSEDRVDVEVLVFGEGKPPETAIVQMVKEGDSWKFAGHTTDPNWRADWQDGHFENLTPTANQ